MKRDAVIGWNIWLQWVLAYTLGAALGTALGEAVARAIGGVIGGLGGAAVGGLIVGVALGATEGLILARYRVELIPWIIATTAGSSIGAVLGGLLDKSLTQSGDDFLAYVAAMALVGTIIGLAQWWVLRTSFPPIALAWAVVCAVALAIGPFVLKNAVLYLGILGPPLAIFARPLVSGAITGSFLIWLLQEQDQKKT